MTRGAVATVFERAKENGFEVLALHHAEAILIHDLPAAISELEDALLSIQIPASELVMGGGGECKSTQRIRNHLHQKHGWEKHCFQVSKIIDGVETESVSHEVDHVKAFTNGTIALEIEWNNKDPFFDRDLENFKRLHGDGAISIGCIITRGESMQKALRAVIANFARSHGIAAVEDLGPYYTPTARQRLAIAKAAKSLGSFEDGWARTFVADKYGEATTHWRKLTDRVTRGVGNPCPLLLIGIPDRVIVG